MSEICLYHIVGTIQIQLLTNSLAMDRSPVCGGGERTERLYLKESIDNVFKCNAVKSGMYSSDSPKGARF